MFNQIEQVEEGREYVSRSGYTAKVLMLVRHGQDCQIPMVVYEIKEQTFDSAPGSRWTVSESFFMQRFREKCK